MANSWTEYSEYPERRRRTCTRKRKIGVAIVAVLAGIVTIIALCVALSGNGPTESTLGTNLKCDNVPLYSRSAWGADFQRYMYTIPTPVGIVFIHHTAGDKCNSLQTCSKLLKEIHDDHTNRNGWAAIGYSFLVDQSGNTYEARGWDKEGAHTKGYNVDSISISFFGNFNRIQPSDASVDAAQSLIECGVENGVVSANYTLCGHRDARPSFGGPGNFLYEIIKKWPHYGPCKETSKVTI